MRRTEEEERKEERKRVQSGVMGFILVQGHG